MVYRFNSFLMILVFFGLSFLFSFSALTQETEMEEEQAQKESSEQETKDEKVFFVLDDRSWKIGYEEETEEEAILELVLADENILNWKELFTIQSFEGLPVTAKEFINALEKTSKQMLPTQFKVIEPDPINIIEISYKANDSTKEDPNEYNIGRVLQGANTIYYLRYSAKDKATFEKMKSDWIKQLKQAYVADQPKQPLDQDHLFNFSKSGLFEGSQKMTYEPESLNYVNKKLGFYLPLSSNWIVKDELIAQEEGPDKLVLLFAKPDKTEYGGVAVRPLTSEEDPADLPSPYIKAYEESGEGNKVIKKGEIQTASGDKGQYFIVKDNEKTGWITLFTKDKKSYRLELWAPNDQFNKAKGDFEKIVNNFALVK